jgi:serine/threonine protein kinase/TolB-like protein/Tfp pilus assembly protein PilF
MAVDPSAETATPDGDDAGATAIDAPPLMTGSKVGRYAVRAILGAGGMGLVWSAHDPDLDREVALKVLRGEAGPQQRARLLREARAMARLKHPNVLTVYEVGTVDGRDFIAMELVDGDSLEKWLKAKPPRAQIEDAILAAGRGLAAAHAAGLVHRDFKPHNVLRSRDGRVMVTDFGLARKHGDSSAGAAKRLVTPSPGAASADDETVPNAKRTPPPGETMSMSDASLALPAAPFFNPPPSGSGGSGSLLTNPITEAGAVVGTPAYMAPEQFAGEPPDPRTDQFAFCVTAWEAFTGARPYRGEDLEAIRDAASSTERLGAELMRPKVRAVLARGLDPEPARRWADMTALLAALERALRPRPRVRPWMIAVPLALAALVAAVAIVAGRGSGEDAPRATAAAPPPAKPPAPAARRAVAIVGFDNLSGDPQLAWVGGALGELLATELATGDQLRVIPGDDVARAREQRHVTKAATVGVQALALLRDDLGADLIVVGGYVASGGLRVDVRVADARTGETIVSASASDKPDALVPLVARLGGELRDRLGIAKLSAGEQELARAAMPSNADAARAYATGLERLRAFDPQGARAAFEATTQADPQFPLGWSALAAAWDELGDDGNAKAAAQQAFELSGSLSRADRLAVEARLRQVTGDHDKAAALFGSLFDFFPDRLDYGVELANEQILAGRHDDAKATLAKLRALGPAGDDAIRVDIAASTAAASRGDFAECIAAGGRAATAADARGAALLAAKARAMAAWGHFNTGDLDGAIALYTAAEQAFTAAGAQAELAATQLRHAGVPWRKGDLAAAQVLVDAAIATYRKLGHARGIADGLIAGGILAESREDRKRALQMFREAAAIDEKAGDRMGMASVQLQIGTVLQRDGDAAGARTAYDAALQLARDTGNRATEELADEDLALLLSQAGEIDGARQHYEDALAIARAIGDHATEAFADNGLGDLAQDRNDNDDARKHYEAGRAAAQAAHDPRTEAESLAGLAEATLAAGDLAGAEKSAEEAAAGLDQVGELDVEASSLAIEARAYARDRKAQPARAAIDRAKAVADKAAEPGAKLTVLTVESEVLVLEGKAADAVALLDGAVADARVRGMHQREYSLRLARGRALLAAGRTREGKAELTSLERDATGRGWTGVAKNAADALAEANAPEK